MQMSALQDQRAPPPALHALLAPTPIRLVMKNNFIHLSAQNLEHSILCWQ